MQEKTKKDAIRVPVEKNELLKQVLERVNANQELLTLWEMTNTNAMKRMGWSDHGPARQAPTSTARTPPYL